jgi:hypothetical protein
MRSTASFRAAWYVVVAIALVGRAKAEMIHTVTITVNNEDKKKTLEDFTFQVTKPNGSRVAGSPDLMDFKGIRISPDDKSKANIFGGNIAPGAKGKVDISFGVPNGTKDADVKTGEFSYKGDTALARANTGINNIFSTAVSGGATGTTFAGVNIPANQWGYFYQFDPSLFPHSPAQFATIVGGVVTGTGFLENTWNSSTLESDTQTATIDTTTSSSSLTFNIANHMLPEDLTGLAGKDPLSWGLVGSQMVATYSTFQSGDVPNILWYTDTAPPDLGGPLGFYAPNSSFFAADGSLLLTDAILAPVPEPNAFVLLLGLGGIALAGCGPRSRKRSV